jgi:hypothetical protein
MWFPGSLTPTLPWDEAMLLLAIQNGAKKLDAFDTVLPHIYSKLGFVATGRLAWSGQFQPPGWDKELFGKFNNGGPLKWPLGLFSA